MPKRAKIKITSELLNTLLGFNWTYNIVDAQIDNSVYAKGTLELIIESDSLPDIFEVSVGQRIKDVLVILHTTHIESEIKVI